MKSKSVFLYGVLCTAINIFMIVDCFTFFNELDMLECRLEYLYDKVDRFVLVEADITHSGKSKPFYFDLNKDRYSKYLSKITHIKLEIDPTEYDWTHDLSKNFNNASWHVENRQRNGILDGIKDLPDNAVIMVSDLDEIPNRDAIPRAIRMLDQRLAVSLETRQFYYNLSQCLVEPWPATVVVKKQILNRVSPQQLRDAKNGNVLIKKGGWHLTYFGSVDAIRNKIMNFAHQEYNNDAFTDPSYIEQRVRNGEELFGRQFPMVRVTTKEFPADFINCFGRFQSMISL